MEQQPEHQEYQETSKEMRLAIAVGTVAFAVNVSGALYRMPNTAAFDWIIIWRGLAEFLMWGGGTYALTLIILAIAPGLPELLMREAEQATGKTLSQPPNLPTGQPRRERQRPAVQPAPLAEPVDTEPFAAPVDVPEWQRRVDEMDYGNGRMLINGHFIELPEGFDINWLYTVAKERGVGRLDETLSLRALDDVGVSRWGNGGSQASQTLAVLEESRCVQGRGANQPYAWTDAGKRAFPSPTD